MATKKEEVRGKVKKLLLGKKELLLDKDEETKDDIQEQLASDIIRMAENGEGGYFLSKWGRQTNNARISMSDDPIVLSKQAHFRLQDLYTEMGGLARKFKVMNGARTDGPSGHPHIEAGDLVVLQADRRLPPGELFAVFAAALKTGWTGIELMDAGGDTAIALDIRGIGRNRLRLKLTSSDGSAEDRHPIRMLHMQELTISGQRTGKTTGMLLFNKDDWESVRKEGRPYENTYETSFIVTKDLDVREIRGHRNSTRDFSGGTDGVIFADTIKDFMDRQQRPRQAGTPLSGEGRYSADTYDKITINLDALRAAENTISNELSGFQLAGTQGTGGLTVDVAAPGKAIVAGSGADPRVREYQQKLADLGFAPADGKIDGKLGPNSRAAIIKFQEQNGIFGSGELDAQTVGAIDAAIAQKAKRDVQVPTTGSSSAPAKEGFMARISQGMNNYIAEKGMGGLVIPASVLLAVGLGGAFAWRKFVKSRENARLAKQLARDREFQRHLQMLMGAEGLDTRALSNNRNVMGAVQDMERQELRSSRSIEDFYI